MPYLMIVIVVFSVLMSKIAAALLNVRSYAVSAALDFFVTFALLYPFLYVTAVRTDRGKILGTSFTVALATAVVMLGLAYVDRRWLEPRIRRHQSSM